MFHRIVDKKYSVCILDQLINPALLIVPINPHIIDFLERGGTKRLEFSLSDGLYTIVHYIDGVFVLIRPDNKREYIDINTIIQINLLEYKKRLLNFCLI